MLYKEYMNKINRKKTFKIGNIPEDEIVNKIGFSASYRLPFIYLDNLDIAVWWD